LAKLAEENAPAYEYDAFVASAVADAQKGDGELAEAADVTVPVQCLVEDGGRLNLFEGSKSDLAGFYDPTPYDDGGGEDEEGSAGGKAKHKLLVLYSFGDEAHAAAARDSEAMRLPRAAHRASTGRELDEWSPYAIAAAAALAE